MLALRPQTIAEQFNTRAAGRDDAGTRAARVAAGPLAQAGPPAPQCAAVVRRLAQAGIRTDLADDRVAFRFAPPEAEAAGPILRLAQRPGFVFALAAATGESDPLADTTSRLFAGLPPAQGG